MSAGPNGWWLRAGRPILAWAVCSLIVMLVLFRPNETPLDEDEIYWVGSSYYFNLALRQGAWRHPDWQLLPARENPPVAKYAIGLGLALSGHRVDSPDMLGCFYLQYERIPGAWGAGADRAKREAVVTRINPALRERLQQGARLTMDRGTIAPARWTMLVCALGASGWVLLMGRIIGGWRVGLLARQLLLLHPAIRGTYNLAMADAVALAFSCLAAWVALRFAGRAADEGPWSAKTTWGFIGGAGAALALAAGAKMNSLVVVAWFAGVATAASILTARNCGRNRGVAVAGTGLGALAAGGLVFVAINPTIWPNITGGLVASVSEHRITEGIQAGFLNGHLVKGADKLGAVAALGMLGYGGLVLAGLAAVWAGVAGKTAERCLAAWWFLAIVAVAAWIPFARTRYVVPVIVPTVILVAWLLVRQLPALVRRFLKTA